MFADVINMVALIILILFKVYLSAFHSEMTLKKDDLDLMWE